MKNKLTLYFILLIAGAGSLWGQATADFSAFPLSQCNPPYEVTFENISQGDTAWHWDFGDGNTSFFPNPIHLYNSTGMFTVTLISYGPGGSDTLIRSNYITTTAPPADPTVNKMADTIPCGGSSQFVATGAPELVWYDAEDGVVARGDTLDLPIVTQDISFFVQSEDESASMFVGPQDPASVGTGGNFAGDQGLIFNVLGDIRLKSVLVEAQGAGAREFELQDTFGVILQTVSAFIPDGTSRVYLDLELLPGNYRLMGDGVNLFRNNNGGTNYPYEIPGLIEITGSTAGANFYYFFYDWEVTTFCRSNKVQVDVLVGDIPMATPNKDTVQIDCGDAGVLVATAPNGVYWYDGLDFEIARGDTLHIPFAGGSSNFYIRNVEQSNALRMGPVDPDSLGSGSFYNSPDDAWLFFSAAANITLESVWVNADVAGNRDIEIIDANGDIVGNFNVMLPAGKSRLNLDLELLPGAYQIGGSNLGLFQNDSLKVSYPFSLAGVAAITGSSTGREFYNFFYDWEISTACLSDRDSVYLDVDQGPAPVVNNPAMMVNCADDVTFVATGSNVVWYDQNELVVAQGDSLKLQNLAASASYSARNIDEGSIEKVGPIDGDSIGNGGYFGFFFPFGLQFEAYTNIRIQSVWVDAQAPETGDIQLNDANGNFIQSVSVTVPAGKSRVMLNLELEPGSYELVASMDLFRNTDGFSYPYTLPGLLSITGEVGFGGGGPGGGPAYYYFYDWEVVSQCKSDPVAVMVDVLPLADPTVIADDSVCYETQAVFTASSGSASWYGPNGDFLAAGKSYQTPPLTASGMYTVRAESVTAIQNVGPLNGTSVGQGTNQNPRFPIALEFTVRSPMRLNSFLVEATGAAVRDIELLDVGGNLLQTISVFIPDGSSRVNLGLEIQPGSYFLSGEDLDLFRNNQGAAYPYEIPGLVSITGSTGGFGGGGNSYAYFYDWQVQELPCTSNDVTFSIFVNQQVTSSFSYVQAGALVNFNNTSPNGTSFSWDFGDGNTSTAQNTSHTYSASGMYTVTLTVIENGCEASYSEVVTIPSGMSIDQLLEGSFQLYPNPGTGRFTITAETDRLSEMQVIIYDLAGHQIFGSFAKKTQAFEESIDLSAMPAGTYIVQLRLDDSHIMRKYVLMK